MAKANETKKKIINAAINLFALRDFSAVTTREIAARAGVNLSLIAYYFKTKSELCSTIIESISNLGIEYLQEELNEAQKLPEMTKDEKIILFKRLIDKYMTFIYSEKVPDNFIALMLKEQTNLNSKYGKIYRSRSQVFYAVLRSIMASASEYSSDSQQVIFEVCCIIGQILSYKLMSRITFSIRSQDNYSKEDLLVINKMVRDQIHLSFRRLGVTI